MGNRVIAIVNSYQVREDADMSYAVMASPYALPSDKQLYMARCIVHSFKIAIPLPTSKRDMCDLLADLHQQILRKALPFRAKDELGTAIITTDGVMVWHRLRGCDKELDTMYGKLDETMYNYRPYVQTHLKKKGFENDLQISFARHISRNVTLTDGMNLAEEYKVSISLPEEKLFGEDKELMKKLALLKEHIDKGDVKIRTNKEEGYAAYYDNKIAYNLPKIPDLITIEEPVKSTEEILQECLVKTEEEIVVEDISAKNIQTDKVAYIAPAKAISRREKEAQITFDNGEIYKQIMHVGVQLPAYVAECANIAIEHGATTICVPGKMRSLVDEMSAQFNVPFKVVEQ